MSPKDKTINLRVSTEWLAAIDDAAKLRGRNLGVPVSRNAFIELAAMAYCENLEAAAPVDTPEHDSWTAITTRLYEAIHGSDAEPAADIEAGIGPE
jgi:hypothetical protein